MFRVFGYDLFLIKKSTKNLSFFETFCAYFSYLNFSKTGIIIPNLKAFILTFFRQNVPNVCLQSQNLRS